jgi:ethanolamine utilization cobalamin adenosyltransferase
MSEEDAIRRAVAESLRRHLKPRNARTIIDEEAINAVEEGGTLSLPAGALVTPLAQTMAMMRRIKLIPETETAQISTDGQTVAIGADHGGFPMKEMIKAHNDYSISKRSIIVHNCNPNETRDDMLNLKSRLK